MPQCLFIDSAYDACSVGLLMSDDNLVSQFKAMRYGQTEELMPMIEHVLDEGNVKVSELSEIVVNIGPGRFTGIRLAIAAAKSLALPFTTKLSGIIGTEIVANKVISGFNQQSKKISDTFMVALSSGRGNYFCQTFDNVGGPISEILDLSPEQIKSSGFDIGFIATDTSEPFNSVQIEHDIINVEPIDPKDMVYLWRIKSDKKQLFESVTPLYVRPPDVTMAKN